MAKKKVNSALAAIIKEAKKIHKKGDKWTSSIKKAAKNLKK